MTAAQRVETVRELFSPMHGRLGCRRPGGADFWGLLYLTGTYLIFLRGAVDFTKRSEPELRIKKLWGRSWSDRGASPRAQTAAPLSDPLRNRIACMGRKSAR